MKGWARLFQAVDGARWGTISGFDGADMFHCFSTRHGGVSRGPYASLNLGFGSGDDDENVARNRRLLFDDIGWSLDDAVFGRQVHGTSIVNIEREHRGSGARMPEGALAGTDGFITDVYGIALVVMAADCAPVYFFDEDARAVGLVHAGWRGTAQGIAARAVREMEGAFGTRARSLRVAVGPGIGPCCYQVGPEVARRFEEAGLGAALSRWPDADEKFRLDLPAALRIQLERAGVAPKRLVEAAVCTRCREDLFFSYRRAGRASGRMVAVIGLRMP